MVWLHIGKCVVVGARCVKEVCSVECAGAACQTISLLALWKSKQRIGALHSGSAGFGVGATTIQRESTNGAGLAPRPDAHQNTPLQDRLGITPKIPPEDHVPDSLLAMEPLHEWFCKVADMTSPAEYEAALCKIESDLPES